MGEMVDAMIDGELDFYTGEYIGPGVGYPRSRNGRVNFRSNHPGHASKAYIGVATFLKPRSKAEIRQVIIAYAQSRGVETPPHFSPKGYAREIQKDWVRFANFVRILNGAITPNDCPLKKESITVSFQVNHNG